VSSEAKCVSIYQRAFPTGSAVVSKVTGGS
jgi:hypothetical protein